ncbi:MAG: DUF3298 and DUF4163 domain-containing protein [Oscillospiraceae bacterium]|nr:DUF3298 and DUF4163 domain-containing protein [Oscillospiraceae bacterium]
MKKKLQAPHAPPQIEHICEDETLESETEPVLSLSISYPALPDEGPAFRRINRYYRQLVQTLRTRWTNEYYHAACTCAAAMRANSHPFAPWEATLSFTVTLCTQETLSLFFTVTEHFSGVRPVSVLRGDTWELSGGSPVSLHTLFPEKGWKKRLLHAVTDEGSARLARGESLFFEDWQVRAVSHFSADRFYLTPDAVVLFYPLCLIAPYLEQTVCFSLPYASAQPDAVSD